MATCTGTCRLSEISHEEWESCSCHDKVLLVRCNEQSCQTHLCSRGLSTIYTAACSTHKEVSAVSEGYSCLPECTSPDLQDGPVNIEYFNA